MWDITNPTLPSPMMQNKAIQTVLKSRTVWTAGIVMVYRPVMGQVLYIIEASRLHSDTPPSVGLLWTSDQFVADTCNWRHAARTTDIYAVGKIRTSVPASLWSRGQRSRRFLDYISPIPLLLRALKENARF